MNFNLYDLFWSYDAGTPFEKVGLNTDSFSLSAGNLIGVLGATGSGKSTFVKLIAGLLDNKIRIMEEESELKPVETRIQVQKIKATSQKEKILSEDKETPIIAANA